MPSFQIKKVSNDEYIASREGVNGHFTLKKAQANGKYTWQLYTPLKILADTERSKTALINQLEKGDYDAFCISEFNMGDWVAEVKHRSSLIDAKTKQEGLAPPNIIHWWKKGDSVHPYYKCDLHTEHITVEGIGNTLPEALESLRKWFTIFNED